MNGKWNVVEALQQSRHDWLNRLQLIKGNMALGKSDQAQRVMDEIVQEMQQEARLTNLKLPSFALMLLTHNWEGHHFQIEYEVLDENGALPLNDKCLTEWMQAFFDQLNCVFQPMNENQVYLTIESKGNDIRFLFHLNGTIENAAELERWVANNLSYPEAFSFEELNDDEQMIAVIFK